MSAALTRMVCGVALAAGLVGGVRFGAYPQRSTPQPLQGLRPQASVGAPLVREHLLAQGFYRLPERRVYRVTAYCDRGVTAAGIAAGPGQCAAPADIPLGSIVYIPALDRTLVVTDRTHRRFRHNTVDIFIPDRAACLRFGRKYLECEIYVPRERPGYRSPRFRQLLASIQP